MIYNDGKVKVRFSTEEDVEYLSKHLRKADKEEIWASDHATPEEALEKGMKHSVLCYTVMNGKPISMFGVNSNNLLGNDAVIWMLSTEDLFNIRTKVALHSRDFVEFLLDYYPYLYNYVDARNVKSIKWLKFCGAEILEPEPYGVEGKPFRYFYFKRS